ncbi:MAG: mechanosensitive ion channel [Alistipes sp.]
MQKIIQGWVDHLFFNLGFTPEQIHGVDYWVIFGIILVFAFLSDFLCRMMLVHVVRRVVVRTKVSWDDLLFNEVVMRRLCHILTPVLLFALLPIAFPHGSEILRLLLRFMQLYIIIVICRFINATIATAFQIAAARPEWEDKPINGLRQTGQGIVWLIGGILLVSILINRSPAILLTGLGASAAIIMLIFRDSILGFVSGIQLSVNNMLKVGDWITMPKYGADGTVEEVSLNTVKIRNWDNTIITLPPYLLVSDSFQNWEAMRQSGGRRVKRSVNIDMTSVQFCTKEMLDKYRHIALLKEYVEQTESHIEAYNAAKGLVLGDEKFSGRYQTNLGVFRAYLLAYLRGQERINQSMTLMVRHLQPTETGIPVELYFFTDTVDWVAYEKIQADVFDHLLAVLPSFDLRVFQNLSGNDLLKIQQPFRSEEKHQ